jgi:hypothetical protein
MRAHEPLIAVAIPHPIENAYAIDMRTQTLPAWKEVDTLELEQTWEKLAINLARTVTGSRLHSVDHRLGSASQQTLYIMKPSDDEVLMAGYGWVDCGHDNIKQRFEKLNDLNPSRLRDTLARTATQALALHSLFDALHTPRQTDVLEKWFAENLGIHNLDPIHTP